MEGKNGSRLAEKTVVITGAASGIGRAAALEFAREKANVVLIARRADVLREVAAECEQLGVRALAEPADVGDAEAVRSAAQRAVERFGTIDVWVNNAGVTLFGRLEEIPPADLRRVVDTNLFGYINGARAVIPVFRQQGGGVLINMSSVAGRVAQPFTSAYNITKFAVNGLSESLREELIDAPGIHVCTIMAPSIDTPLFQHAANFTGRAVKPMSPVYKAELVARAMVQLARHPKREIIVGMAGKQMVILHNLLPSLAEKLMAGKVTRDHFRSRAAAASEGNLFKPMDEWTGVSGGWTDGARKGSRRKWVALTLGFLGAGFLGLRLAFAAKKQG